MQNIYYTAILMIAFFTFLSCEFNRSLEGEPVNLMSDAARTSNYEKYGELYLYSAYSDFPVIEDTTGSYVPPLALAANKVVLTNLNGLVTLIAGKNPEWIAQLDSNDVAIAGMAADPKQNIYLIANSGSLYSYSNTGELRWKKTFPHPEERHIVFSDLLALKDAIVIASNKGLLAKIDFNGNIIWEKRFPVGISRTFSADEDGNLLIPLTHRSFGRTDTLLFLDKDGNKIWSWSRDEFRIMSYPVFSGNSIYIAGTLASSNDQNNLAITLNMQGKVEWEVKMDAVPRFISTDSEKHLYVISYNLGLGKPISIASCYSADGNQLWEYYYKTTAYSPMIIGGKYICFSGRGANTTGIYFMEKNGKYIKTVSLSNLPDIVMKPEVKPDGVTIFAGSERLAIIRIDEIWINKIIPW